MHRSVAKEAPPTSFRIPQEMRPINERSHPLRDAKNRIVGQCFATELCIPCGMRVIAKLIIVNNDTLEKIEPLFSY